MPKAPKHSGHRKLGLPQSVEPWIAKFLGPASRTGIGNNSARNPEQSIFRPADVPAIYGEIDHRRACPVQHTPARSAPNASGCGYFLSLPTIAASDKIVRSSTSACWGSVKGTSVLLLSASECRIFNECRRGEYAPRGHGPQVRFLRREILRATGCVCPRLLPLPIAFSQPR